MKITFASLSRKNDKKEKKKKKTGMAIAKLFAFYANVIIMKDHINIDLQASTKYLRLTLVFMRNSALREKSNFCFSRVILVLTKFSFWQED